MRAESSTFSTPEANIKAEKIEHKLPQEVIDGNIFLCEETERRGRLVHAATEKATENKNSIEPTSRPETRGREFRILGIHPQLPYIAPGGEKEYIEPLGLQYVLTQAANKGHKVELLTLLNSTIDKLIEEAIQKNPEVVAISAMTPQMPTGLEIATRIKERLPRCKIVFGGYHPSAISDLTTPELITSSAVDFWVRGEGEQTFSDLLDALEADLDPTETVPGLSYLKSGHIVSGHRDRVVNLDEFGRVWRPDFIRDLRNRGLTYPAPSEQTGFASLDYSRGCLGNCEFCASPETMGELVSFRSPESVAEEIKFLHTEMGINTFFFTDLDFIQKTDEGQDRVRLLCRKLKELKLPIYWECLGGIKSVGEMSDAEGTQYLKEIYDAGCRKIAWGLESIDPQILRSMHKTRVKNMDYRVLKMAEEVGILNSAFYMIGWYNLKEKIWDSRESIVKQMQALPHYPIHRLRVTIATPLPGSTLYKTAKSEGLLTTDNLGQYDTENLVYRHPAFNAQELYDLRSEIYRIFYSSAEYHQRVKDVTEAHPEYKKTFQEFLSDLRILC
jgi:radical SAM superfamily enzyme YgiQ (UPF0313 family)